MPWRAAALMMLSPGSKGTSLPSSLKVGMRGDGFTTYPRAFPPVSANGHDPESPEALEDLFDLLLGHPADVQEARHARHAVHVGQEEAGAVIDGGGRDFRLAFEELGDGPG